jgi:hypothetical protein
MRNKATEDKKNYNKLVQSRTKFDTRPNKRILYYLVKIIGVISDLAEIYSLWWGYFFILPAY